MPCVCACARACVRARACAIAVHKKGKGSIHMYKVCEPVSGQVHVTHATQTDANGTACIFVVYYRRSSMLNGFTETSPHAYASPSNGLHYNEITCAVHN